MPYEVAVTNDGSSYKIDGSSTDLIIGPYIYTFTGVPQAHPMKFVAHGVGAYACVPTLLNTDISTGSHYAGTVRYDFSACTTTQSSEFQCGNHGRMSSGKPRLTVNAAC